MSRNSYGLSYSFKAIHFTIKVNYKCCATYCIVIFFVGVSATSEDIPNKIEDLRSECSSDFGGKDSVTSPDGEDSVHGTHTHINITLKRKACI